MIGLMVINKMMSRIAAKINFFICFIIYSAGKMIRKIEK